MGQLTNKAVDQTSGYCYDREEMKKKPKPGFEKKKIELIPHQIN